MARQTSKHPTDLELAILKVLWTRGPSGLRKIQDGLGPERALAYTTVATMLTIMASKGFVRKSRAQGGSVYEALLVRDEASSSMLRDLVERVYDGSTLALMQSLLDMGDIDSEELAAIRRLINRKGKENP